MAKNDTTALVNPSAIRRAIAECESASEAKTVDDKLIAMERLARRAELARKELNKLGRLRIECRAKIGALLPVAKVGRPKKSYTNKGFLDGPDYEQLRVRCRALHRAGEDGRQKIIASIERAAAKADKDSEIGATVVEDRCLKKQAHENARGRSAARKAKAPGLKTDQCHLFLADITDDVEQIEDAKVDVIITDPPYSEDAVPLYAELSAFAARVLKPGGSCFAMSGQTHLPELLPLLGECLTYQWVLAYLTPGGQATQVWPRKAQNFWKPVLWYVKGEYSGPWVGDVAKSDPNDNDKRFHDWGQSESGMLDLIARASEPGQTICDPFLGGGTTAVAALSLGRRFVGFDKSAAAVRKSVKRIKEIKP